MDIRPGNGQDDIVGTGIEWHKRTADRGIFGNRPLLRGIEPDAYKLLQETLVNRLLDRFNNVSARTRGSDATVRDTGAILNDHIARAHGLGLQGSMLSSHTDWLMRGVDARVHFAGVDPLVHRGAKHMFPVRPTVHTWFMSEKFDGYRVVWNGQELVSKKGVTIRPPDWWSSCLPPPFCVFEGELVAGRHALHAVESAAQNPASPLWRHMRFMIFDVPGLRLEFRERLHLMQRFVGVWKNVMVERIGVDMGASGVNQGVSICRFPVCMATQYGVSSYEDIRRGFNQLVAHGDTDRSGTPEGVVLRLSSGLYVTGPGRTTAVVKMKPSMMAVGLAKDKPYFSFQDGCANRRVPLLWHRTPADMTPVVAKAQIKRSEVMDTVLVRQPVPFYFFGWTSTSATPTSTLRHPMVASLADVRMSMWNEVNILGHHSRGGHNKPEQTFELLVRTGKRTDGFAPEYAAGAVRLFPPWDWDMHGQLRPTTRLFDALMFPAIPDGSIPPAPRGRAPDPPVDGDVMDEGEVVRLVDLIKNSFPIAQKTIPHGLHIGSVLILLRIVRDAEVFCDFSFTSSRPPVEQDPATGLVTRLLSLRVGHMDVDPLGRAVLTFLAGVWAELRELVVNNIATAGSNVALRQTVAEIFIGAMTRSLKDWEPLSDAGAFWDYVVRLCVWSMPKEFEKMARDISKNIATATVTEKAWFGLVWYDMRRSVFHPVARDDHARSVRPDLIEEARSFGPMHSTGGRRMNSASFIRAGLNALLEHISGVNYEAYSRIVCREVIFVPDFGVNVSTLPMGLLFALRHMRIDTATFRPLEPMQAVVLFRQGLPEPSDLLRRVLFKRSRLHKQWYRPYVHQRSRAVRVQYASDRNVASVQEGIKQMLFS